VGGPAVQPQLEQLGVAGGLHDRRQRAGHSSGGRVGPLNDAEQAGLRDSSRKGREGIYPAFPEAPVTAQSGASCTNDLYNIGMAIETSYSDARQHLAALLDRAVQDRETIIITRRNGDRVALLPADDLASYEETAHLLRSPANARRLLEALRESLADEVVPFDFAELRARLDQALARDQG
jgi:antitoxin YefM